MRTRRRPARPPNSWLSGASALRAAAIFAALALAGCSDVPSWANPADWYKGAESVFTGGDDNPPPAPKTAEAESAKERIDNAPIPGEGQPFPNLASVPPRPTSVTPPGERKDIQQALISDREHARYIEEGKAPRSEPATDTDITAAPHAPVTAAGPIPPPPAAAEPTPAPKGASQIAQSHRPAPEPPAAAPPPPAPAPAPTPQPSAPGTSAPSAEPGAPRSLGRLVIGPSGEVKQALPGDNSALPNTAVPPPAPGGLAQGGMSLEPTAVVLFNVNATKLSPQQTNGLKRVAEAAERAGAVRIVGHASPARNGNSTAALVNNFQLAWARAKAVADALTKLGVPAERLHVEADTSPAAPVPSAGLPTGDAGLRRTDIFLQ